MTPDEKARLHFGPYGPPALKRGGWLWCAFRGKVKTYAWSHGRIPWPLIKKGGGHILCGDLERAIRRESVAAVAHWWGVRRETVSVWRRLLEVPRMTEGTRRLCHEKAMEWATPERMAKMRDLARTPAARAKISRSHAGKPIHPRTRKALLAAAKRPKSERHKQFLRRMILRRIHQGEIPFVKPEQLWTRREIEQLGRRPDREVAEALGRSLNAVRLRRIRLGIPNRPPARHVWTPEQIALLGAMTDRELAEKIHRPVKSVTLKRQSLKIAVYPSPNQTRRPLWTGTELQLLGTMPDHEVARQTGRSEASVTHRRRQGGIPKPDPKFRDWTAEEEKLLGTRPDAEIASQLNRVLSGVSHRRIRLKIPAWRPR
jgi:hypothetical protein